MKRNWIIVFVSLLLANVTLAAGGGDSGRKERLLIISAQTLRAEGEKLEAEFSSFVELYGTLCPPSEALSRAETKYLQSWHAYSYAIEKWALVMDDPETNKRPTARLEIADLERFQRALDEKEQTLTGSCPKIINSN